MDDDLVGGSTAATGGTPAAQPAAPASADWNTSLAVPAPVLPAEAGADVRTAGRNDDASDPRPRAAADPDGVPRPPRKPRPAWQDPADLPAVQRVLAGPFGEKLKVLKDAARTTQAVLASIDVEGLSDPELVALTQVVEQSGRPVDAGRRRGDPDAVAGPQR